MPALDPDLLARALLVLEARSRDQGGVFSVAQALATGLTPAHLRTLVRRGAWIDVRHGVLALASRYEEATLLTACAAKVLRLQPGAVVSHVSAWNLYELPYLDAPAEPTLTVASPASRPTAGVLESVLPPEHVTRFGTVPVTTGPRTVVDVLRTVECRLEAQGLADGALRAGVRRDLVAGMIRWCEGWPGITQARDAWEFGDGRSESPLESRHRLIFRDAGLPVPELQVKVRDRTGRFLARVDFLFRAQRTIVESDGKVKYVGDTRRRNTVLWDEKVRETGCATSASRSSGPPGRTARTAATTWYAGCCAPSTGPPCALPDARPVARPVARPPRGRPPDARPSPDLRRAA